jgi:putative ABC transport system permease protein
MGWMLAGLRRQPGPMIGTLAAAAVASALTVAAFGVAGAHWPAPLGRLAGADVVVAAGTQLRVTLGAGDDARTEATPLQAYRGVPAALASELARVPGVSSAVGETGFPDGTVRPGLVDLVAVKAAPGVSPATLAQRIRAGLPGDYTVATGADRANLADPGLAVEAANGQGLGGAVIPLLIITALFTLAGTTALSVELRRRRFALLRAVGATRGQVRRAVLAEQGLLGLAGGVAGYLPGIVLGGLGASALAAHGMLPAGAAASASPLLMLWSCLFTVPVCLLSALLPARRAARTSPARAVAQTQSERTRPNVIRLLLGLAASAGTVVLSFVDQHQNGPGAQVALAGPMLAAGMTAVTLLGPALVTVLATVLATVTRPLAAVSPAVRLALAGIARLPRRTASAVIPVALAVGMIGAVAFSNTTFGHAATTQSARSVTASYVLGSTGGDLDDGVLARARALPGVRAAVGLAGLNIGVTDPDLYVLGGEAVSSGPASRVLDLAVTSGSLAALRPGQVAVSALEASKGMMGVQAGDEITVYLPDGTPYRATVSAVFRRSLALGDVLIPASVADGHAGTPAGYSRILVSGGTERELAALAATVPGVQLTSRAVYNTQVAAQNEQNSFGNNLILGVIAALAAVTMINTLAVSTVGRRQQVRLLARIGATSRQLAATFGWQALFVTVAGIASGTLVCAATLVALDRAVTGNAAPYIPAGAAALVVAVVAALTVGTVLTAFAAMTRPRSG